MTKPTPPLERRAFLRLSAAVAAGATLGCSRSPRRAGAARDSSSSRASAPRGPRKVLLVFFSRAGENYFHGGRKVLAVGNTAVVAGFVRELLGCDVFEIRPVEPYPDRYEPTVQRNVREQDEEARPAIIDLPASIAAHDTIVIGSPIWNVRVPRIILTFAERYDFTGKTVYPFTTHAMSGLGHAVEEYAAACRGATLGEALAIQGEEADEARPEVEAWLRRVELLT
jgi:flavodoxin